MEEVKTHNKAEDCWIAVNSKVYDVTSFLGDHPGGKEILLKQGGTDATKHFLQAHAYEKVSKLVDEQYIGELITTDPEGEKKRNYNGRN